MLSGDVQLKEQDRQMIDAAFRDYLARGGRPQAVPIGAAADLGTGRERLNRVYVIGTGERTRPARARGTGGGLSGGASLAKSSAMERAVKAPKVRELAAMRASRAAAARQLGISLGTLRRITSEHGIRFARDRAEGVQ